MNYDTINIGMRVQIVNTLHRRNGQVGKVVKKMIVGFGGGQHSGEWVDVDFDSRGSSEIDTFRPRYLKKVEG